MTYTKAIEYYRLGSLISRISQHTDTPWYDVLEIEECNRDNADEYMAEHRNDLYEVQWPQHSTYPKFNSDAIYILKESE